jgi:MFS family permease
MRPPISEPKLVVLIGANQFINTLDFTMVLPLGPDFAKALDIPVSKLGMLGGSYIAATAVTGIAGAFFLDRFDRAAGHRDDVRVRRALLRHRARGSCGHRRERSLHLMRSMHKASPRA